MEFILSAFLMTMAVVICGRLIRIAFKAIKRAGDWLEDLVLGKKKDKGV